MSTDHGGGEGRRRGQEKVGRAKAGRAGPYLAIVMFEWTEYAEVCNSPLHTVVMGIPRPQPHLTTPGDQDKQTSLSPTALRSIRGIFVRSWSQSPLSLLLLLTFSSPPYPLACSAPPNTTALFPHPHSFLTSPAGLTRHPLPSPQGYPPLPPPPPAHQPVLYLLSNEATISVCRTGVCRVHRLGHRKSTPSRCPSHNPPSSFSRCSISSG